MAEEFETKQKKVVNYFLAHPKSTIIEISEATGISKSSCQRYLNLPGYAAITIPATGKTIAEQLKMNRISGNQKGGRTTFLTHVVQKDAEGKFIGTSVDESNENKEEKKRADIIRIVRYFSQFPYSTLEEITTYFDKIYTPSYIYDCLNDPRVDDLFGKLISSAIKTQLSNNRYGIIRKFGDKWGAELFKESGLNDREIEVLNYRFSNDHIRSAEEVALILDVSKTTVTNIEDIALKKIEQYKENVKEK